MAIKYILDTSVAIKWFSREDETDLDQAGKLLHKLTIGEIEIYTLYFLLIELANALMMGKKMSAAKTTESCHLLQTTPIKFIHLNSGIIDKAAKLAERYRLTIYDGLYLALATDYKAKLITADKKLLALAELTVSLEKYH
ncbi:MAG: PilT protein domain protein [Candidatus Gottesmanbacteria bacterium GW2011_GWA2_43_14]|uniref:PilT protein domain protein n=1 Tax=Candidatus Gottesmanbacteria bacterium GW2011_GWA2_43_14 TaxID=1618443 RepID=A0A0G1DIJ1_9BACT|nr:MAG: PilT protein domain protein [Candidatus Gottesmanbacteria bacterium GW2011_GWA2_43_14]